ncbi:MAG: acetylxylan esterase [Victivallales bacterium]|nr:acetylxylan esterase [Victivallales bacterium]
MSYSIDCSCSHSHRAAKLGETVAFFGVMVWDVQHRKSMKGSIQWKLYRNRDHLLAEGEYLSSSFITEVAITANEPGWFRCDFTGMVDGESVASASIGVLVAPELIRPSLPVPADFDDFWKAQLARLRRVKLQYDMTPLGVGETYAAFDLQGKCVDRTPVSGIFYRPRRVRKGKHPAILVMHGAGVRSAGDDRGERWVSQGFLTLEINALGLPNGRSVEEYEALYQKKYNNYSSWGWETGDCSKVMFNNMFLRVVRALEILQDMDEWDGKNLWLMGGSQAAWQTIAGGALCPAVSGLAMSIPAGCDIYNGGWPLIHLASMPDKDKNPLLKKTIPYFDECSFATRVPDIPVCVHYGLADMTCKADGVTAMVNSLKSKQTSIVTHPVQGHGPNPRAMVELIQFVLAHLK